ncbi:MAG: hypothetical protein JSR67_03625 [Proteobacteria bacterium]|nr:hypothetical protein [Pseudomonadota bacterium]
MPWVYLILLIVSVATSYALRPRPPKAAPATLADVNVPQIEIGKPVAVAFGEVWIDDSNVLWFGDLNTFPITQGGKK